VPTNYTPKGETQKLGGTRDLTVYIVGTPNTRRAVILVADVLGMASGRHRAIADQLADEGYYVILPDFFHGDCVTFPDLGTPRLGEFIKSWPTEKWTPDFDVVYQHLSDKGIEKTGLMGFCWGSWAIFWESARTGSDGKIHCGVNCHPSLIIEQMLGGSVEELAKKTMHPMLMFPCVDDPVFVQPEGAVDQVLRTKSYASEFHVFSEQNHGFVSQGDVTVESTCRDVGICMDLATKFFAKHLS